jgi:signal transduction histidine kinase
MKGPVKPGDVPYGIVKDRKSYYSEDVRTDRLWRTGQVIAASDSLPERPSFTDRESVKSAAGILLKAGKETVGVMFIASRRPRRFSDEEKHVIETFAAYAALAIQGARRFVQSVKAQRAAMQRTSESLTHRLRNVLPVISDRLAKTLEMDAATGDGIEWCRMALVAARQAQKIVKEFVRFSRAERFGCPDLFTGLGLVQKLGDTVKGSLTQEGAEVEVLSEAGLPRLKVNFEHLSDDFIGFLRDSERHTPSGLRIAISAEVASDGDVKLAGLPSDKTYLKLIYIDNGPGVPADLKQKIFEPFYTTSSGSGLGLAIVEHNMKVHGGAVIERGEPGKGVRFELYLPILKAAQTGEGT